MATETAIDVVMPQMGVSVSEGTITKWLKREGDTIEADEPLLEISTDKVDTEVPSPASGVVTQILVQEGETVDVGTKLAQIGGAVAQPAAEAPPAPAPEPAPPGRRADRVGARRRPGRGAGHRPRRPRDEAGHPELHRQPAPGCARGTGAHAPGCAGGYGACGAEDRRGARHPGAADPGAPGAPSAVGAARA